MSGLDLNTYYGNVSQLGRIFNRLDSDQTAEAIEIAQINLSKVHSQSQGEKVDLSKISFKREPIEYVIEEPFDDRMEL